MITGMIHWAAGAEALGLIMLFVLAGKCKKMDAAGQGNSSIKWIVPILETGNVLFVTVVSIFPLLGMLGTVMALLNLDMAGDMEGLKNHFFQALDTTRWGIIYAAVYKLGYAFIKTYIEKQIANGKEMQKALYR